MKAYGLKKDYNDQQKVQRRHLNQEQGKAYYPNDRQGIVDEWGALSKTLE